MSMVGALAQRRATRTVAHEAVALAPAPRRAPPARLRPSQVPLRGSGRSLEAPTRRTMEERFGGDFSGVRVHDDAHAAATADGIGAAAFTVGQDIVFGAGEYAPSTSRGRQLLAHELAHTVQQRGRLDNAPPLAPGSRLESNAEAAGRAVANGLPVTQPLGSGGVGVARQLAARPKKEWIDDQLGEEIEAIDEALMQALKQHESGGADTDVALFSAWWWRQQLEAAAERSREEARKRAYARREAAYQAAHPLDTAQLLAGHAIARAAIRPAYLDAYNDEQLEDSARILRVKLRRRPEYPDRDSDLRYLDELTTEIARRAAIAETMAVVTGPGEEPEEHEEPTPRPAQRSPASRYIPPSTLTYEDFERDRERDRPEVEKRLARPPDPRPFMDRFYAARRHTPLGDQSSSTAVWSTGTSEGLFREDDLWAFEKVWEDRIGTPARDEARHNANVESIHREMAWEAQGERVLAESQSLFLQPFAFGGLGKFAEGVYATYSWTETALGVHEAVKSGNPADIVSAFGQLGAALLTHRAMRTGEARPAVELPPERAPTAPGKIGTEPLPVNPPAPAPLIKSSTELAEQARRAAFQKGGGKVYGSEAELRAEQLTAQSKRAGRLAATSTEPAPGQEPKKYAGLFTPEGNVVTRKGVVVPPERKVTAAGAVKAKTQAELRQLPKVVAAAPAPAPEPLVGKPSRPVEPGTFGKVLDPSGQEVLPGPSVTTRAERPFGGKNVPGTTEYGREGETLTATHEYPDAVPLGQAKGFNQHEAFDFVVGGEQSVTRPVTKTGAVLAKPGLLIKGGTAVSHLELDLGAKSYIDPDAVYKSVRDKIDAAVAYPRTKAWSLGAPDQPYAQYTLIDPQHRVVHIAMTKQPTEMQMQGLAKARLYAAQKNVELVLVSPQ